MGVYKSSSRLNKSLSDYKQYYASVNKLHPNLSKLDKQDMTLDTMITRSIRNNNLPYADIMLDNLHKGEALVIKNLYSRSEQSSAATYNLILLPLYKSLKSDIKHFYIPDEAFCDWLGSLPIKTDVQEALKCSVPQQMINSVIQIHTKKCCYILTISIQDSKVCIDYIAESGSEEIGLIVIRANSPVEQFILNFLMYMKACPENIRDGAPKEVKHDTSAYTVSASKNIIDDNKVGVQTHFRRGFFRHYNDDRYVNMKGKVQFIESTIVKGKAKVVMG